ncbi:AraC family transcriptional regulator [uncultured Chitinophaga sp.]|jgi:AraC-type DNA-binding domain-containing proteins|uniref:helix-turn-helix domain-containing protein n=1 Tax=uncultured Chitinophaga sp. TaxID=339340 RepID=UPI00261913DE|nr:helix-turn-helix transcriptional regulator [uncultured Chitinophaga sp.]
MSRKNNNIPVNSMADDLSRGISIEKLSIKSSDFKTPRQYEEATRSHRDEGHTFYIIEKGAILIEIDFQQHRVTAPALVYMHPNQVHRILKFYNITVCSLSIHTENVNPPYLQLLEDINPVKPLVLMKDTYTTISDCFSFCLHLSTQKNNRLYHLLLKDGCNAFIGLAISALLHQSEPSTRSSRAEVITQSFKQLLEKNYNSIKRPQAYAEKLNISTHYLNESVKQVTGLPVSQHIQERIILEAKRLLFHTDKSIKEIAFDLGYEDYPYFSRLFSKATGITAAAFRNKRHE